MSNDRQTDNCRCQNAFLGHEICQSKVPKAKKKKKGKYVRVQHNFFLAINF